jgi:hypothetical protein
MIRIDFVYLKGLMTLPGNNYFLSTICHLRSHEEMLIYDRFASITIKDEQAVGDFLREEYERECIAFPGTAPRFEPEAAIWAGKIVFNASQLLLSREKGEKDVLQLLPPFAGMKTPAAVLSADLCLRCLPDVIAKAGEITPDDPLIPRLEGILWEWHYSGVGYFTGEGFDWEPIAGNDCLLQLYIDRVIDRKAAALAHVPVLRPGIMAAMGDHGTYFWKEL